MSFTTYFGVKQNNVYAVESLGSKKNAILASAIQYIKSSQNEDGSFGDTFHNNSTWKLVQYIATIILRLISLMRKRGGDKR